MALPLALLRLQGTPWKARHLRGWSRGVRSATRRPARPLATRLLCLRRHLGRVQAQGQRQRQCQGQRQTRGQGHARPCLRPCLAHGQRLARLCQCLGQRQCQGQRRARGQGLARPCLRPCLAHGQRLSQPWPAMAGPTLPFSPARPRQRMTWRVWFRRRQWEKARRLCRSGRWPANWYAAVALSAVCGPATALTTWPPRLPIPGPGGGACWPAPSRDAVATTCTVCAQTGLVGRDGISSSAMDRSTASNGQMRLGVPEEPFGSQGEGADGAGFRVCVIFAHGCGVLISFALK